MLTCALNPIVVRVRLTSRADAEVYSLYRWGVEHFGLDVANEYYDGLFGLCDLLAGNPRMAKQIRGTTRVYPYRSHVIIFREATSGIEILHIRHGMSIWRKYL